jgi:hypothetical protein
MNMDNATRKFACASIVAAGVFASFNIRAEESPYSPRTDWGNYSGDKLNISSFIYRDRNRNGRYDLGDRAMASVAVDMTKPDATTTRSWSNINGFTNFVMSAQQDDADIQIAGQYKFRVVTPPHWKITSGNVEQNVSFVLLPGSYADIVAKNPAVPVGLAPDLTITGRATRRDDKGAEIPAAGARVTLRRRSDTVDVPVLSADGRFSADVMAGDWTVDVRDPVTGTNAQRTVSVNDEPVVMSSIVLGENVPAALPVAQKVDFENITQGTLAKIPSGIDNVDWNNMVATDVLFYDSEGIVNAIMSGHYVGYNGSAHPVSISRAEGFDFAGGYFGLGWLRAEGEELQVEAWRGGKLVGSESIPLSAMGPVWFDADYRGIDKLVLKTKHYWQFVADDLQLRLPIPDTGRMAVVP